MFSHLNNFVHLTPFVEFESMNQVLNSEDIKWKLVKTYFKTFFFSKMYKIQFKIISKTKKFFKILVLIFTIVYFYIIETKYRNFNENSFFL